VTVGASTTAVLGMMAGYGMADRANADAPSLEAVPAAPLDTAAPVVAPTTQPPQVVVVVIDGATGQQIGGTGTLSDTTVLDIRPHGDELAANGGAVPDSIPVGSGTATAAAPASEPAPVAAPVAIDVAVPKSPPRPAPSSRTAPAPQAESGGS
jgi:hypothetical protein